MKAVFLGTPEFAVPSLEALLAASEIVAVVTRPDRPQGRGLHSAPPPVAEIATRYALEVLQPASLRDPALLRRLRDLAPDLLVAVAYGRLIPPAVLEILPLGGINLHPSLLPHYRGAAPIPRAIAAGETETGITVLYITEELDAGDIILQRRVAIDPADTSRTLEARLAEEGAALLGEAVELLASGRAPRIPQDPAQVTWAPKLSREEALIRWSDPAGRIANLVRALDPWPVAYTLRDREPLRIWRATPLLDDADLRAHASRAPGTVLRANGGLSPRSGGLSPRSGGEHADLIVAAGRGSVVIHEVQPASGRRMSAAAYLRGHPLAPGTRLGGADT